MLWCVLESVNVTHYETVYMHWIMTADAEAKEIDILMEAILTTHLDTLNIQRKTSRTSMKKLFSTCGCTCAHTCVDG
jgi:hypothetical protein